jgi:hypothetical protein
MKVKLITIYAGPNGSGGVGDEIEGTYEDLKPLLDGGYAVPVRGEAVEQAVVVPEESTHFEPVIVEPKKRRGRKPRG